MRNELWQRLRCDAASKLKLHVGISLWIMLCYYPPQHFPLREPVLLKPDLLPFLPSWAVIYQSVFLLHTYAIWGAKNARAAWQYVRELAAAFAIGAVFFWLWPTRIERPASPSSWLYEWLIARADGAGNAFPSLHAAFGLLAVLHVRQRHGQPVLWLWLGFMLVSTLLTRQHVWQDLPAGLVLGLGIHRWFSRSSS